MGSYFGVICSAPPDTGPYFEALPPYAVPYFEALQSHAGPYFGVLPESDFCWALISVKRIPPHVGSFYD